MGHNGTRQLTALIMENLERSIEIPEEQRRRKKEKFIASPEGGGAPCELEAEYWEIRPGVWEKIHNTEKVIGPAPKEEKNKPENPGKELL